MCPNCDNFIITCRVILVHAGLPELKDAGMTGVSRGIEYPLLHEILHTVSEI